jgi:peptidoglycan-associated lipoprotein
MIRTQRGRGGLVAETSGWRTAALTTIMITALALAGCSSQKAGGAGAEGQQGQNGSGVNEGGLNGSGGSSLAQFGKTGTVGGEGGPLSDIYFDYNDFTVREQDGAILKTNADWLQKNANTRVQIEGHCDDRGSEEYNIALGAKRAQAAKDYLETLGIGPDRLSTISYGKELPQCTEQSEDCWQKNRRDHFVVTE